MNDTQRYVPGAVVMPCEEPQDESAAPTGPVALRENTIGQIINSQLGVHPRTRPVQDKLGFVPICKVKGSARGVKVLSEMDVKLSLIHI